MIGSCDITSQDSWSNTYVHGTVRSGLQGPALRETLTLAQYLEII